uniref:(northern house mosquito) hypothetical protein n=1 Tax=Culex pipiens TaxID=7175 RepID=A0A8D8ALB3_CULPI
MLFHALFFFTRRVLRPKPEESFFALFHTRTPRVGFRTLFLPEPSLFGLLYSRPSTDFRNKALFRAWVLRPAPSLANTSLAKVRFGFPHRLIRHFFTPGHYFSYPAMKDQNVLQKLREFQADCIFQFKFSTERKNAHAFCASDK